MKGKIIALVVLLGLISMSYFMYSNYSYGQYYYAHNRTYVDENLDVSWPSQRADLSVADEDKINQAEKILDDKGFVHSMVIIHKDKLYKESYFGYSKKTDANNIHSASKSILSALVGIAIEEGYIGSLDDSIALYLPETYFEGKHQNKKDITIRHLLTMTAGLSWEEDKTEYQIQGRKDWVKAILHRNQVSEPGTFYTYSTGVTHVMAAIVTNATDMDLKSYAESRLFNKLGVTIEYWKTDPQGIYSGGCNFFMTPIEMAKFGQLYLNDGIWQGERILPEGWVENSYTPQTQGLYERWGYGYYWWLSEMHGYKVASAWGFAGQMIHVIPELDLVVVTTTNSTSKGALSERRLSYEILETYIIPAFMAKVVEN